MAKQLKPTLFTNYKTANLSNVMITLNESIHISTGILTPISKEVGKDGVFYLCDYKSSVNSCYDDRFRIKEKELILFKNFIKN